VLSIAQLLLSAVLLGIGLQAFFPVCLSVQHNASIVIKSHDFRKAIYFRFW